MSEPGNSNICLSLVGNITFCWEWGEVPIWDWNAVFHIQPRPDSSAWNGIYSDWKYLPLCWRLKVTRSWDCFHLPQALVIQIASFSVFFWIHHRCQQHLLWINNRWRWHRQQIYRLCHWHRWWHFTEINLFAPVTPVVNLQPLSTLQMVEFPPA